jgi:hypothetical protein
VILEGIVTTLNDDGSLNVAPMGPRVGPLMDRFVLRPFRTSTTCHNLLARGEGVLHVTDDVLLFARTAIGLPVEVPVKPAATVRGEILLSCCRYHEFRVSNRDEVTERVTLEVVSTAEGRFRDFFGFNRAKHAVIEAAILATRTEWVPITQIATEFEKLADVVEKTGGSDESRAMALLIEHVRSIALERGANWEVRSRCVP